MISSLNSKKEKKAKGTEKESWGPKKYLGASIAGESIVPQAVVWPGNGGLLVSVGGGEGSEGRQS